MNAIKKSAVRGRPRSFDLDEAVERAMTLFHRRGYDAVGVAELGQELGIKPPSFYAAFGSKAGLFQRALERYTASKANVFGNARAKGGSVTDVMEQTLLEAARIYPERDGRAGCLVHDGTRNSTDPEACALTTALKAAGRAQMRDFIATEFPTKADELANLVTIALAGMSSAARDGAKASTLKVFAEAAGRAFRLEAGRI